MFKNIIITNPEKLEKVKKAMIRNGTEKFHVLADFDRTLTKAFVGGKIIISLISILRDGNYLMPGYAEKAQTLYDKYRPIEIDPKITFEEKNKPMNEWWSAHFDLLIKSGLSKQDIENAVDSGKVKLRYGIKELVGILHSNNVPLVILSASGMGIEAISMYLEKAGVLFDNILIVSNAFEWDKNGKAISVKQPIIHSLNKSELAVRDFPFYEKIKERKNVLLLGDSIEDANMADGLGYNNLIKIGFLNEDVENNIELYKNAYDIIILNDGSMRYINSLLKEIIK